jgi:glycosyltransferase involved in cell wall biosynthesis
VKRLRLCFVGWGDHVHVERWAGYFAKEGHEVSVVSFSGTGCYPEGVTQYRVGLDGRGQRWIDLRLRYLLWRIRPDLVHVHWAHFGGAVRRVWGGPLVVTAWGSDVYLRSSYSVRQWSELCDGVLGADLVTADSDDLVRTIVRSVGADPCRVEMVQWGVDTDLFVRHGPDLRGQLGLQGRKVILSARNFTPIYNQETVVTAFSKVLLRQPAAFLLMKSYGGDPDYIARIRQQISSMGLDDHIRVIDTVPYEEMPALYRTADVTVSIPFSDAMPMSVLEAMSVGSIPVVSDLASLREWVRDGENGFLVDSKDVDGVARCVMRALKGEDSLREAARQLVVTTASQRTHMSSMLSRYEALVSESRALVPVRKT